MVTREGFVYTQNALSVTRNVVVWQGWSLVRVVVRQGFYCTRQNVFVCMRVLVHVFMPSAVFSRLQMKYVQNGFIAADTGHVQMAFCASQNFKLLMLLKVHNIIPISKGHFYEIIIRRKLRMMLSGHLCVLPRCHWFKCKHFFLDIGHPHSPPPNQCLSQDFDFFPK